MSLALGPPGRWAVTGSSGFVGRALTAWLTDHGHDVLRVTRAPAGETVAPGWAGVPAYDDVPAMTRAFSGCDVVVHLAALAHVIRGAEAVPLQAFRRANRDSAQGVARAAREAGVRRLVLVSSIGVNGDRTSGPPFRGTDPPAPAEPYAVTKWEGEQAVALELAQGSTDFTVLRPTLVYGPGCPGNFQRLLKLVHALPVVPLGAMRAPRSFVFVENLCSAIAHAGVHPGASRRTFLVADGVDTCVRDVALQLLKAMGRSQARLLSVPLPLLQAAARLAGAGAALDKLAAPLAVDASGLSLATGWQAPVAPAQGLATTARAYLQDAGR